jgi:NAD(P)-dependent dehydrogenase (short-subunit alcohol dehydrogenase family)
VRATPSWERKLPPSSRKEGVEALFVALDVTLRDTIEAARAGIEKEFGRLDILVNNAGIADRGGDGPPSAANIEAVSRMLQTNFVGALAVAQAMLPLIRKSAAGRIVNVSSELGSITGFGDPTGSSGTPSSSAIAPRKPR